MYCGSQQAGEEFPEVIRLEHAILKAVCAAPQNCCLQSMALHATVQLLPVQSALPLLRKNHGHICVTLGVWKPLAMMAQHQWPSSLWWLSVSTPALGLLRSQRQLQCFLTWSIYVATIHLGHRLRNCLIWCFCQHTIVLFRFCFLSFFLSLSLSLCLSILSSFLVVGAGKMGSGRTE